MGDVRQEIALYNKSTIEILCRIITRRWYHAQSGCGYAERLVCRCNIFSTKKFRFGFQRLSKRTTEMCFDIQANVLIMEVTAYTPWRLEERMKIRDEVKAQLPNCKIVLVVDENTEKKLADKVRQAKKDGLVDNFIYGSVSSTYLSAVIDAL